MEQPRLAGSARLLGIARAEVIQAGLLANPSFTVLFPAGPKQLEFTVKLPVEALVLRPRRIAAAELEAERTAAALVEEGLSLIQTVRAACGALRLAREKAASARGRRGDRRVRGTAPEGGGSQRVRGEARPRRLPRGGNDDGASPPVRMVFVTRS